MSEKDNNQTSEPALREGYALDVASVEEQMTRRLESLNEDLTGLRLQTLRVEGRIAETQFWLGQVQGTRRAAEESKKPARQAAPSTGGG